MPSPGNPQALNRYAYAVNNPVRYTDPSGHEAEGGFRDGAADNPVDELRRQRYRNWRWGQRLYRLGELEAQEEFGKLLASIHPGSIGILSWHGALPGKRDVGHAVVGVADGVFLGTSGATDDYGVYMTSAAAIHQSRGMGWANGQERPDGDWSERLAIYEVQGLDAHGRRNAAEFARNEYGAGYSYTGLLSNNRESRAGRRWYCSELTVAALEKGSVTFYSGNSVLHKVWSPGLPAGIPGYRTLAGRDTAPLVTARWNADPLIQTWP